MFISREMASYMPYSVLLEREDHMPEMRPKSSFIRCYTHRKISTESFLKICGAWTNDCSVDCKGLRSATYDGIRIVLCLVKSAISVKKLPN